MYCETMDSCRCQSSRQSRHVISSSTSAGWTRGIAVGLRADDLKDYGKDDRQRSSQLCLQRKAIYSFPVDASVPFDGEIFDTFHAFVKKSLVVHSFRCNMANTRVINIILRAIEVRSCAASGCDRRRALSHVANSSTVSFHRRVPCRSSRQTGRADATRFM